MKNKLCLGIMYSAGVEPTEQVRIFKEAGFEGFFSDYPYGGFEELRKAADELQMEYQSIHAAFHKMRHMWYESEETEAAKSELKSCVDECAKYNVPIMVAHPFIGFDVNEATAFGVKNFREVVDYARDKGIKVAFENVEGEAYLEALMNEFKDYENVGFCWDTGHEMCYNRCKDMLAIYGDRLLSTHINDNLGVKGEEITCVDDLHMLPFDGVKDWQDAMSRLDKCGFDDIMTFELVKSKDYDKRSGASYFDMKFEDYVKEVYERAQKLLLMRS